MAKIQVTIDPTKLKKDGSNADSDIDIGSHKLTAKGLVIGDAKVSFVLSATISGTGTTQIYNANAPIAFRVIDAWSVNTAAQAGAWKLNDGSNDICAWIATSSTDKAIERGETIDDAYHEIAVNGTLNIDHSDAKVEPACIVYVLCIPI